MRRLVEEVLVDLLGHFDIIQITLSCLNQEVLFASIWPISSRNDFTLVPRLDYHELLGLSLSLRAEQLGLKSSSR